MEVMKEFPMFQIELGWLEITVATAAAFKHTVDGMLTLKFAGLTVTYLVLTPLQPLEVTVKDTRYWEA